MGMNPTDSELRAWWKVTDKNSECTATSATPDYIMYNCLYITMPESLFPIFLKSECSIL